MREIRFRGIRADNREWAYGYYQFRHLEEVHSISFVNNLNDDDYHFVAGNTVGQFTGLKDKNGVEIYEGDIVRLWIYNDTLLEWARVLPVIYCEQWCQFVIDDKSIKEQHAIWEFFEEFEIIGNIHENPELLK